MSSRPTPLPNRVRPDGVIEAAGARGTLMGNRGGRLHEGFAIRRQWASRRWIACLLSFRGRQRQVMGAGYTELFFLDEATALAAGHRPCFECRRAEANAFAAAWARAFGLESPPRAEAMDLVLHAERRGPRWQADARSLPDGAMILCDEAPLLVLRGHALPWSHEGYGPARPLPGCAVAVLTPPAICAVLAAGYRAGLHESAGRQSASR
ncbi:MAG: hypothetical protein D6754_03580 [Alphaproteobacteria bacterium]|nr:MAG: hypothetical protein D6754_03580 [Alphaproteobacteria bacterium]